MHTSTSLVRGSFVLSMAVALLAPAVGEADVAETLGKPGSRLTATAASRDATRDAGDYYTYRGGRIFLARSLEVVGVRFAEGVTPERAGAVVREVEAAASVELAGRPPTRGVSLVRVRKPADKSAAVPAADPAGPVLESLRASAEVLYAFPVLVNPATGNRLLLTDEVAARLRPGATAAAVAAAHGLVEVERLWGTLDEHVFRLGDPKSQDPLETANRLAASDLVLWAEPNFVQQYSLEATPNDPTYPSQWHLNNTGQGGGTPDADVDAPEAWDTTTGSSSVVVAIIDDGVEATHEDLSARIFVNPGEVAGDGIDNDGNGYVDDVKGWDFSNDDNDPSPMVADDNHGTAVAGVAAATGNNGLGVTGACQSCRILPVKVFSPDFVGDAAAANAIRYAASLADVLNNSWGGGSPSAAIQSAIQWAVANGRGGKGSAVFFASGNFAGAWIQFSIGGFPAGTHLFRWRYTKDSSVSSGEDTAWLGWVEFPGGERVDFESGSLPAGFSTSGDASWSVVSSPSRADEGRCLTKSAKAGTISHSQSTYLDAVKTVPGGTLVYKGWVSSESGYDTFDFFVSINNTGSFLGPYLAYSGVPYVSAPVAYPAAHPESIAVGAVSDFDCRSAYSQYGPELDVVAPSNGGASGITTTDRTGSAGYDTGSSYTSTFGGTSSATPLTSGVAGLVLSADSSLTEPQIRSTLQGTADKVGPEPYVGGRNDRYGYGRVNAQAAVSQVGTTIDPTTADFGAGGGSGAVTVTAAAGHAWTAVSNDAWVTVTSGASGTGNGTVEYSVAANTGTSRTGTMTVAGRTFTVNQASGCTYALDPTSAGYGSGGGSGSVGVTAGVGCGWTAVSNDAWITVTDGSSGTGSGTVSYSVAASTTPARTGTMTIAGLTFTVNQASGCTYALDPTSAGYGSGGGGGSVGVTAGVGCGWTAVSNDGWITVTGGASGAGNGTVSYSVAASTTPARSGTITIGGQTFTANQASGCTYALDPTSAGYGSGGGSGSVAVTAGAGCAWTAASNDGWITVTGGSSDAGNGTVSYDVAATTGPARSGTITIGGQTFTVDQASGCTYALDPTSAGYGSGGGSGSVGVTAGAGCGWTAVSNDGWITVTGGASGAGNGMVSYTVAATTGPARAGTMTIGGHTFTVDQASGCTYTLVPTSATFGLAGGDGDVGVTTAAGCDWTASSNDAWITITGGASGTGGGTVSYSVEASAGGERTGTMTIGGQTFTVVQSDRIGFYTVTPCRAFDSRLGPHGPALSAGETRLVTLVGGACGIPPEASAVSFNVTVTGPTVQGHLRLYPAGSLRPGISTINYVAGQNRANNGVVVLGTAGQVAVYCNQASGTAHVIVDVNGYFLEE